MKFTAILLLAASLGLSAAGHSQEITISAANTPLDKVMAEIKKQSGYTFLYTDQQLQHARPVSMEVKDVSLQTALELCFANQPLSYEIINKTIVIKPKVITPVIENNQHINEPVAIEVTGRVVDSTGAPLQGASVTVMGTKNGTTTDANGYFTLKGVDENATLEISYQGFELYKIKASVNIGSVSLKMKPNEMDEILVNTGYQKIKPNEWIGSAAHMNREQINRVVSPDILSRLQNMPGLLFKRADNGFLNIENIIIRTNSTIFSKKEPLIVIDNFPLEGDASTVSVHLNTINPNDIENITILKDAAATSIYGVRAANGVIVITTKRGRFNQAPKVTFNSSITLQEKPDLSTLQIMNSKDYVDVETYLYNKGYYNNYFSLPFIPVNPAVEILSQRQQGLISAADSALQLNNLRQQDARDDLSKYYYKTSRHQQYALNLEGGSSNQQYYLSLGYDHLLNSNSLFKRYTLTGVNTFRLFKNKLEFTTGIVYSQMDFKALWSLSADIRYPYARLADENGNALPLANSYRHSYTDTAGGGKLLNWDYYPLNEYDFFDNRSSTTNQKVDAGLTYKIIPGLTVDFKYQYHRQNSDIRSYNSLQTFSTRDLINTYTNLSQTSISLRYPIPMGGILNQYNNNYTAHNGRGQINYSGSWNNKHRLTALAGSEVRDVSIRSNNYRLFGYNENNGTTVPVDLVSAFPTHFGGSSKIPSSQNIGGIVNRVVSYYGNFAYIFLNRYSVSASARRDGANLFGVTTNNKWKPLWSAGLAWNIDREPFYKIDWLDLRVRGTYGYQGNVPSTPALLTINYANVSNFELQTATVRNIPNPNLRWEKTKQVNLALDFSLFEDRFSGSIEHYHKQGTDLMGQEALAPTIGFPTVVIKNSADMKGKGWEITFNSYNIRTKTLTWLTNFTFSYAKDWVTAYKRPTVTVGTYIIGGGINPIVGRPVNSVYSYKWAGLDPETGDPRGYLNKQVSKDYAAIQNSRDLNEMVYNGPAIAPYYGGMMNSFKWKDFSFSFFISYKFGHVFRRNSIDYNALFLGQNLGHPDYVNRWQKKGDEQFTNVPSMVYIDNPYFSNRDLFYSKSEILVEKGDNIRLQDIRLGYDLTKNKFKKLPFQNCNIYLYSSNLGVLWKATKENIDPDFFAGNYFSTNYPWKSVAIGLNIAF